MPNKLSVAVVSLFIVGGLIGPAAAEDDPWEPILELEAVYFTCEGIPLGNVSKQQGPVPWTNERPTDSELGGAGCRSLDWTFDPGMGSAPPGPIEPLRDPVTTLTFAGTTQKTNLDTLTFRLWAMSMGDPAGTWPVEFGLRINGEDVVPWPTPVAGTKVADGFKDIATVTVTGIDLLEEEDYLEHEIEVTFRYDEPWRATLWQWGAAEGPSGVTFNPNGSNSGAVVDASG